jgi:hypothetical protein
MPVCYGGLHHAMNCRFGLAAREAFPERARGCTKTGVIWPRLDLRPLAHVGSEIGGRENY